MPHLRVGSFSCFGRFSASFVNLCLRLRSHGQLFKQSQAASHVDVLYGKMMSLDTVPLNPALNGFSIPYVGGEPDYSEHIVRGSVAWMANAARGTSSWEDLLYYTAGYPRCSQH